MSWMSMQPIDTHIPAQVMLLSEDERDSVLSIMRRAEVLGMTITPENYEEANSTARSLQSALSLIEAARKRTKEVFLNLGRRIDAAAQAASEGPANAKRSLAQRISIYQRAAQEEADRVALAAANAREAEVRRLQELEQQRAQAERAALAALGIDEQAAPPAAIVAVPPPVVAERIRSAVSTRKVSDVEVYDVLSVPRQYLVPDTVAIGKALRAGQAVAGARLIERTIEFVRGNPGGLQ